MRAFKKVLWPRGDIKHAASETERESSRVSVSWARKSRIMALPKSHLQNLSRQMCRHINDLPVELLELLFVACVDCEEYPTSPMILSQVCKHWRTVALGSARVWTRIDLFWPNKAKRYLELSQEAALQIYWRGSTRSVSVPPAFMHEWAWKHAHRFIELTLRGDLNDVQEVVSRLESADLAKLSKLFVNILDYRTWSFDVLRIPLSMPHLLSLHLRCAYSTLILCKTCPLTIDD